MISDTEGIAPITIFCATAPRNIETNHKGTPINPLPAIGGNLPIADENDIGAHRGRMPGIETAQLKIQIDHTMRASAALATRATRNYRKSCSRSIGVFPTWILRTNTALKDLGQLGARGRTLKLINKLSCRCYQGVWNTTSARNGAIRNRFGFWSCIRIVIKI